MGGKSGFTKRVTNAKLLIDVLFSAVRFLVDLVQDQNIQWETGNLRLRLTSALHFGYCTFAVHHGKNLAPAFLKVLMYYLFDNLMSTKRSYCFGKVQCISNSGILCLGIRETNCVVHWKELFSFNQPEPVVKVRSNLCNIL